MTGGELLAENVGMRFGGVTALAGASIRVGPGEIVGLIGRNGSGKSTLFNCITGFLRPTGGKVTLDGRDITSQAPDRIVRAGICRTFQTPRIDPRTSVREAVTSGFHTRLRTGFLAATLGLPAAWREEVGIGSRAEDVMEALDRSAFADEEIGTLAMGRVRLVEVARCLAAGSRFILLDEPAAGLTPEEQVVLAAQIRRLAEHGQGVLLVEHNFELIRALCSRITVLDMGRILSTGTPAEIEADARVIAAYLGVAADVPKEIAA